MHRIIQQLDPAQLQQVLMRYAQHRKSDLPALASDGKRIRGTNRNGARHYKTATLVEHNSGLPWGSVTTRCEGQEIVGNVLIFPKCYGVISPHLVDR